MEMPQSMYRFGQSGTMWGSAKTEVGDPALFLAQAPSF